MKKFKNMWLFMELNDRLHTYDVELSHPTMLGHCEDIWPYMAMVQRLHIGKANARQSVTKIKVLKAPLKQQTLKSAGMYCLK